MPDIEPYAWADSQPAIDELDRLREDLAQGMSWKDVLTYFDLETPEANSNGKIDLLCVFHDERTPSMRLWPEGLFRCHGCGIEGDLVDFVIERASTSYALTVPDYDAPEAVADLRERFLDIQPYFMSPLHPEQMKLMLEET